MQEKMSENLFSHEIFMHFGHTISHDTTPMMLIPSQNTLLHIFAYLSLEF